MNLQKVEEEIEIDFDKDISHANSLIEDAYRGLLYACTRIPFFFEKWIQTINVPENFDSVEHEDNYVFYLNYLMN